MIRISKSMNYYVVFTSDCTATYDQTDHEATLRNIEAYFGEVVTAEAVQACWQAVPARLRAVT
jgi:nicotinamidase-related amidase